MGRKVQQGILPLQVEETEEPLVARGGLVVVYEMAQALGISQGVDKELPPPGSGRGYKPSQFVMPMLLMFHGGGRKLEDLREMEGEASLRELLGMKALPASCTVGDWLRRMGQDRRGLCGLSRVNDGVVKRVLERDSRQDYTLDPDATVIEVEKEEAQWTYKKEKGYQPLVGFLFEAGLVLHDEFRDGNVPAGAGAVAFLEACRQRMPRDKRIGYLRSDSAFYQAGVLNWCEDNRVLFTVTADQDKAVKEVIKAIRAWRPCKGDREIGETVHTMEDTFQAFRLVVQRWPKRQLELFDPDPYEYRAIATNREETAEEVVDLHNQRGEVENYIKELKGGFGMEWMPCGESYANAVFFRLGVLAYNLFLALKILGLPTEWRSYTIGTVRWRLYQIACRVVHHARRVVLKMAATIEKVALIRGIRWRCLQMAYNTS